MVTYTPNKGYGYPAHGAEVNNWDAFLNAIFTNVDLNVGGTNTTAASSITTNIALAAGDGGTAQYMHQRITGTLSNNVTLTFPSTDLGGAFGGFWIVSNETTGSFSITALTTSSTNSGVILPSGRTLIVSDGTNVNYANNTSPAKIYTYLGNPSSAVAGNAGTTNGSVTDAVWDATNKKLYVPAATGVSTGTLYLTTTVFPAPQGYLTAVSNTPIITSNQTVSTIFYTPFTGAWVSLPSSGGNYFFAYQFSQQSLSLSPLGANNIYDAYMAYLSSVGIITGFGPSWTVGGGSISAGSGARGTGAGSAQITRGVNGQWLNTNAMNIQNGGTTYSVAAGAALMIGSVYTASAGAVSCTRTGGQNMVWGIFNANNAVPLSMQLIVPNASWTYASTSIRVANNSTANSVTTFFGLPQTQSKITLSQRVGTNVAGSPAVTGIGYNSVSAYSGQKGLAPQPGTAASYNQVGFYAPPISIGSNVVYLIENVDSTGYTGTYYGTASDLSFNVSYEA